MIQPSHFLRKSASDSGTETDKRKKGRMEVRKGMDKSFKRDTKQKIVKHLGECKKRALHAFETPGCCCRLAFGPINRWHLAQ